VNRNGNKLLVNLDGPIGETTKLFTLPIDNVMELTLEMSGVTFINSIGVKHWIIWTLKIPAQCKVKIVNCPFVIVSQASTVVGFITPRITIESFRMPYNCERCNYEETIVAKRGNEFEYSTPVKPKFLKLPSNVRCPKCKEETFQPDFMIEKTFKFLT